MKRFVKDVSFPRCKGQRAGQPFIIFRVRGYNKILHPPKHKIHLTDLGMKPCKLDY